MTSLDLKREWKVLAATVLVFAAFYAMPLGLPRFDGALLEAFRLARWYAREHVLLCLVPAFFIAGAIAVFLKKDAVMRWLGPAAPKAPAYAVASVSGGVLAVCSCTVLPLFAGIYRMGAGLGPACAFLYAGPAVNVLAVILTARILGPELGIARAIGAVLFSILIGLAMQIIFGREDASRISAAPAPDAQEPSRSRGRTAVPFVALIAVLIFANWGRPASDGGIWFGIYELRWFLSALAGLALGASLAAWYGFGWKALALIALPVALIAFLSPWGPLPPFGLALLLFVVRLYRRGGELGDWLAESWGLTKQILPLLLAGVLVAGLLLGRPGEAGLIPAAWIEGSVGGNGLGANLFASFAGALMYFATLTEVPILQGLIGAGMGKGPALALLLAGPALSLPNMLVIASVMGAKKTIVFVALVVLMATLSGWIYGNLV